MCKPLFMKVVKYFLKQSILGWAATWLRGIVGYNIHGRVWNPGSVHDIRNESSYPSSSLSWYFFSNHTNLGALSTRNMSKFSLARAVGTTAEGMADAVAAAAAEDEVGEITLEPKGALQKMVQTFGWNQTEISTLQNTFPRFRELPRASWGDSRNLGKKISRSLYMGNRSKNF